MVPVNPKHPFESHNTLLTLITLQYTITQYSLQYSSPLNISEGCIIMRHEVSKPQQHSMTRDSAWVHFRKDGTFLQLSSHLIMEPVTSADSI